MQGQTEPQSSLEVLAAAAQTSALDGTTFSLQDAQNVTSGNNGESPLDLSALLQDPSFLSAVATLQTTQSGSIYAQFLLDNMASSVSTSVVRDNDATPVQQTRSGRIVRPPLSMPTQTLFQDLIGQKQGQAQVHAHAYHHAYGNSAAEASTAIPDETGKERREEWRKSQRGTERGPRGSRKVTSSMSPRRAGVSAHNENGNTAVLPQFPLPPTGPNGRKNMPKEEMLRRRRERNRVAAVTARQKRKQKLGTMEEQLRDREEYCTQLEARCNEMEKRVDALEAYIISKGLDVPGDLIDSINNLPGVTPNTPSPPTDAPASLFGATTPGIPSLDMYLNIGDDDEEADGDFLPQSSPRGDDSDSETDDDGHVSKKRKRKSRGDTNADRENAPADGEAEEEEGDGDGDGEGDDDDEFIDPEVWDEDLFMPIEDVPVPPLEELAVEAMRSMGAKTKDELREVVAKLVNQGRDGVTAEQLKQLKGLLTLMGARGVLATGTNGQ